jgi:hypothetical protein
MAIIPDPTGGGIKLTPKQLALKEIAALKKSLDQLQKTVKSIKPAPNPPKKP